MISRPWAETWNKLFEQRWTPKKSNTSLKEHHLNPSKHWSNSFTNLSKFCNKQKKRIEVQQKESNNNNKPSGLCTWTIIQENHQVDDLILCCWRNNPNPNTWPPWPPVSHWQRWKNTLIFRPEKGEHNMCSFLNATCASWTHIQFFNGQIPLP